VTARILRLDQSGIPVAWLSWQYAASLYAKGQVNWTLGDVIYDLRGGISRITGDRSRLALHAIIACQGSHAGRIRKNPPLSNSALFRRDQNLCLYCGQQFSDAWLTRDHVVPLSRGGKDHWCNVVAACRRCNQKKGSRLLEECQWSLLALPYRPNMAEYLALINSDRIRGDQMAFLRHQFSREAMARTRNPIQRHH